MAKDLALATIVDVDGWMDACYVTGSAWSEHWRLKTRADYIGEHYIDDEKL